MVGAQVVGVGLGIGGQRPEDDGPVGVRVGQGGHRELGARGLGALPRRVHPMDSRSPVRRRGSARRSLVAWPPPTPAPPLARAVATDVGAVRAGPLAWPPVPAMRSRRETFDDVVIDVAERAREYLGTRHAAVEFAVEEVPTDRPRPVGGAGRRRRAAPPRRRRRAGTGSSSTADRSRPAPATPRRCRSSCVRSWPSRSRRCSTCPPPRSTSEASTTPRRPSGRPGRPGPPLTSRRSRRAARTETSAAPAAASDADGRPHLAGARRPADPDGLARRRGRPTPRRVLGEVERSWSSTAPPARHVTDDAWRGRPWRRR